MGNSDGYEEIWELGAANADPQVTTLLLSLELYRVNVMLEGIR